MSAGAEMPSNPAGMPPPFSTTAGQPVIELSDAAVWPQLMAWLVLTTGVVLSLLAYSQFQARAMEEARIAFEDESREAQRAVETRLNMYSSLLLGLRSLHRSAGGIEARSLHDYVAKLELPERFPAVLQLDYVDARSGGKISYPGPYGSGRPEHPDAAPGMDAEPALVEAIRDGGDFTLFATGTADSSVSTRLAVYQRGLPVGAPAERRQAFAGSVGMTVSLGQLSKEAVSSRTLDRVRIRLHVLDRSSLNVSPATAASRELLFDSSSMAASAAAAVLPENGSGPYRTSQYRFGNALLEFEFTAKPHAFDLPLSQVLPVFVLMAGTVISLLLFGLLRSLASSRRVLAIAVIERTRDLEAIRQALGEEVTERDQLEREISHLNVDERSRFSQDLQDNIAQRLTAIGFMLESIASELRSGLPDAHALATRAGAHIGTAIAHTRLLAHGINPVAVEAGGLISALTKLADSTRDSFGIDCRLEHDGCDIPENALLQHNLYRIVQQAITNAITHGKANRVTVALTDCGRGLRLSIVDNGGGLSVAPLRPASGLGLEIMRYRCSVLGLNLTIQAVLSGGTAIVIEQAQPKA